MKVHVAKLAYLAALVWFPGFATGQQSSPGTVTGHGVVELRRTPEVLRIQVEVLAKGKDVKEALARLKDRREAAQRNLEILGAIPASVEFGNAQITDEKSERQKMMEMVVAGRAQGKKANQKAKQAPPIVVSAKLKAEVPLKAASPEDLLVLAHVLEEKIKAADLGGMKELKQLSSQDEESAEENQQGVFNFSFGGEVTEVKRGEPSFSYVSKVSEEEQSHALADAYQKARREASRIARAAGVELGTIHHLEETVGSTPADEPATMTNVISQYMQLLQGGQPSAKGERPSSSEATGAQPGMVTYRLVLSAAFNLKQSPGK